MGESYRGTSTNICKSRFPAITLYKNSGGHGHVQVIRPSDQEYNPDLGAYIAQAGSTNFNKGYTSQVYSSDMRENEIEYYIHK